jgi:hypothetical protein
MLSKNGKEDEILPSMIAFRTQDAILSFSRLPLDFFRHECILNNSQNNRLYSLLTFICDTME